MMYDQKMNKGEASPRFRREVNFFLKRELLRERLEMLFVLSL
jgi:hypothetical protein